MTSKASQQNGDVCATLACRARVRRRCIRGHVPPDFENFYRAHLRFVVGARVRRLEVAQLYDSWATENDKQFLNLVQIKRAMGIIGHGMIESHGMYYLDLGLAASFPDLADNYPALWLPAEAKVANISDRLGAMITELIALRAEVARAGGASTENERIQR
jgi:hypothetical protein